MSVMFYKILFFSLAITIGLFFMFYGYRYFIRRSVKKSMQRPHARLISLESPRVKGEIQFRFELPEEDHICLEICDSEYKPHIMLAEGKYLPGEHVVRFDSVKIGNGVYFYRLRASGQETMKKMEVVNS